MPIDSKKRRCSFEKSAKKPKVERECAKSENKASKSQAQIQYIDLTACSPKTKSNSIKSLCVKENKSKIQSKVRRLQDGTKI